MHFSPKQTPTFKCPWKKSRDLFKSNQICILERGTITPEGNGYTCQATLIKINFYFRHAYCHPQTTLWLKLPAGGRGDRNPTLSTTGTDTAASFLRRFRSQYSSHNTSGVPGLEVSRSSSRKKAEPTNCKLVLSSKAEPHRHHIPPEVYL